MTPGTHNITLYRGTKFSETLELTDTDTGLPYDLTAWSNPGDFVAEVRMTEGSPVLATITVSTTATPTDGLLNLEADVSATSPIRDAQWGIMDTDKQMWIVGRAKITIKIPELT